MRDLRIGCIVALVIALCACTSIPRSGCRPGEQLHVMETIYFGTEKPGGAVTMEEWRNFVDLVVTPRFKQGLTSWDASGQWQGSNGVIERESTHVLQIVHSGTDQNESAIREIIAEYKVRFDQEAVLRVRFNACVSF